jgi:hypothetical protein
MEKRKMSMMKIMMRKMNTMTKKKMKAVVNTIVLKDPVVAAPARDLAA